MLYGLLFVLLLFAYTANRAVRDEHVVVLRWSAATFFLEHRSNGQYRIFPRFLFPLAVLRYAGLSVIAAAGAAFRRVHRRATHRPAPAHFR